MTKLLICEKILNSNVYYHCRNSDSKYIGNYIYLTDDVKYCHK